MILYFSATGNNCYLAQRIADATNDKAVSMETISESRFVLSENEAFGIVVPTYFLELPLYVEEFLQRTTITLSENNYVFAVVSYGSTSGACGAHLKKILQGKGVQVDALFSIITPDTWTPVYDLSDADQVRRTLAKTNAQLEAAMQRIVERKSGDFRTRQLPYAITTIYDPLYRKARKTAHFHVENTCIGCGLCERNCPVQAIRLENGKPVWVKESCTACLRCLHSCPKFSIQYSSKTAAHGQYHLEKYRKKDW